MERVEKLTPRDAVSFYGKAKIIITDNSIIKLISYNTCVLEYNLKTGIIRKLWGGYSVTTMRHINAFLEMYHRYALNKQQWNNIALYGAVA